MTLFQDTIATIERELDLSSQKIEILDSLQRQIRSLSVEENKTLSKIQRTNTGILALLLEHKASQYKVKNSSSTYDPFIIDTDEDKIEFLQFIENFSEGVPYRFDFIIGGSGKHATPVTMIRDERSKTSIFSLDAAVFYDNFSYLNLLEDASKATKVYNYEDGGIQNSAYGCTIYSIQHLSAMSRMSERELSDMFREAFDKQPSQQYKGMSPKIVRNIQSISSYKEYIRERPGDSIVSKGRNFVEYVSDNIRGFYNEDSILIERNSAHAYITHKYLLRARDKIATLTQDKFDEIVFNRSVGKVVKFTRSSPVEIQEVDELSGRLSIVAALEHKHELRRREVDLTLRKLRAEEYVIGETLSECGNPNIIEAVCRFGINEEQAMNANCFKDPHNKRIAISFLRKAQRETSYFTNNGAQLLFEIIKDNECIVNGEIKRIYDFWVKQFAVSRITSESKRSINCIS